MICTTLKGQVYNLKMYGGYENWKLDLDSPIFSTPVVVPASSHNGSDLLVANVKGVIYKINLATRKIMWILDTKMHIFAPLTVLEMKLVCAMSREGQVHAIDIDQSAIKWSLTMEKPVNAGICLVSKQNAIVLDNRASYKLIRSSDGFELSRGSLQIGETFSTPLKSSKNHLLIGSRDDNVYCFTIEKNALASDE